MQPTLSIIIIVKNDRGIAQTCDSLESQRKPAPTEIIVVDASPNDSLADIRAQHTSVRWIQYAPLSKKSSIPEQRNLGIREARGSIIVFIDANCVPDDEWLVRLTSPILDGSESITAGSVRASDPAVLVNLNPIDTKHTYLASSPTINVAFKKSIWNEVGAFDEKYLYGSDVDFTWRATNAEYRILFVRGATVTHDWGNLRDEIKRSFRYGTARARLLIKHPQRRSLSDETTLTFAAYSAWILGLVLTPLLWWYPLTILIPIVKNIRHKPLKTVALHLIGTIGFLIGFLSKKAWR